MDPWISIAVLLSASPIRGGFAYLPFPRWALGVPAEPPRSGRIGELRVESGILRIRGSEFRLAFCVAHPRRFRLFIISALGIGR